MDHICTWFCADEKGEESIFPQTGESSSGQRHQDIYWRCIILFFSSSRRFNRAQKHVLFTNVKQLPMLGTRSVSAMLSDLDVAVVFTDFKYKTPKGYFQMFQNQFYEFSILEHITKNNINTDDNYMIVDSDCLFLKTADEIFKEGSEKRFLSFEDDCTTDLVIHGLSRVDMKVLYEDLLGEEINEIPGYHLGEFFLASVENINILFSDFLNLWPIMLRRFSQGLSKFNEEAQTLSFLYFKNKFIASPNRKMMKRIWTNPAFYRNVEQTDVQVILWHLPSEKTYGLADLYKVLIEGTPNYGFSLTDNQYVDTVQSTLSIPNLSVYKKLKYYYISYSKALHKRLKFKSLFGKLRLAVK